MVMRIGTSRRKTRKLYSVPDSEKGRIKIRNYLQSFDEGEKVFIGVDPSVHAGLPYRRFVGKSGVVAGKQGSVYRIRVSDGGNAKTLLIHPAHLRAMGK